MQLSDFDFELDNNKIALSPLRPAHHSKMLVVNNNCLLDKQTINLPDFLNENDCLIFNDTKVIKARLNGQIITQGRSRLCEITLHKILENTHNTIKYCAFAKGSKKLKINDIILFAKDNHQIKAIITDKNLDTGEVILEFQAVLTDFFELLDKIGTMPLPPYIAKKRKSDDSDNSAYQSFFAKYDGSVAAPTASLHFDNILINKLKEKNIKIAFVTLHVGGGTFLPVKTENIDNHIMHSEYAHITDENAKIINDTVHCGGRIVPVGTTALRVIETASDDNGVIHSFCGQTNIFIRPGYKFKITDMLLTNFHLPKSTLLMLVCALAGYENMMRAYKYAINNDYRFFSYGDACLLYKNNEVI